MKLWKEVFVALWIVCTFSACETVRSAGVQQPTDGGAPVTNLASGFRTGKPHLVRIFFNPYTDSIKTVLNYYVNVEGQYSDGTYLPMDSSTIILSCDHGTIVGNEWVIPKKIDFEKVTFTAVARENPKLRDTITLWIQKWKDPRDAPNYVDPEEIRNRR